MSTGHKNPKPTNTDKHTKAIKANKPVKSSKPSKAHSYSKPVFGKPKSFIWVRVEPELNLTEQQFIEVTDLVATAVKEGGILTLDSRITVEYIKM